jgi:hypothetical protein
MSYFSNISRLLQFNLTEHNQSNGYAHDRCNSAETGAAESSRECSEKEEKMCK